MAEITFNDENFNQEVLTAGTVVLVDFWAPWCGPCRLQGPIIEELAKDFAGKPVKIGKLNVDENMETAQKYNVMSIPTIMIFKNNNVAAAMTGVQTKELLTDKLNSFI